jgi:hypothetical protein
MDRQEGFSTNRSSLFDGSNYAFWSIIMKTYLMSLGFDIWIVVKNGYTNPTTPPIDTIGKGISYNNAKSMNAILCGLVDFKFSKSCIVFYIIYMKGMTRSRRKNYKHIEDNLRALI